MVPTVTGTTKMLSRKTIKMIGIMDPREILSCVLIFEFNRVLLFKTYMLILT